jgi:hypothetical protein
MYAGDIFFFGDEIVPENIILYHIAEYTPFVGAPDVAIRILTQGMNCIVSHGTTVFPLFENGKTAAVIAVQPVVGANPQKSAAVLQKTIHDIVAEPLVFRDMMEHQVGVLAR